MHRRTFLCALSVPACAGAAAAMGGCGRSRAPDRVVVAVTPNLSMTPVYLALEAGYFRDVGLEVTVTPLAHSAAILPVLAGGRADVGLMALTAGLVNTVIRGGRVRIVAGRDHVRATCADSGTMLIRKAAFPGGLQDLRELRGRRLGLASAHAGGVLTFLGELILEHAGLTANDVELVDVRGRERVLALVRGEIDATLIVNDYSGIHPEWANDLAYVPVLARLFPDFQYSFVQFGPRLLDADPATGVAFLSAYLRGTRAFAAGATPSFVKEFAESNRLDYATLEARCRDTTSLDGAIHRPSVARYFDWLVRRGLVDGTADVSDLIDDRFAAAAAARLKGDV